MVLKRKKFQMENEDKHGRPHHKSLIHSGLGYTYYKLRKKYFWPRIEDS